MDRFHPPGFIDDFARLPESAEDRAQAWSEIVSAWMDNAAHRGEPKPKPEVPPQTKALPPAPDVAAEG